MTTARVLIMESDAKVSTQLADVLQKQGFSITQCQDAIEGTRRAYSENFDLVLIDALLPKHEGLSPLQQLRIKQQTPTIILSPFDTVEKRIESFQQGADDYIPKPINPTEIILRVNALLKRTLRKDNKCALVIDVDQLTLLKSKQQVLYKEEQISLTPIQFRLLWILVENRNQVVSKPFLYQAVLDRKFSRDDRSLEMHLSRIRKKLIEVGMSAGRFATVHGRGYRFS
ncbi:response regulator transcription factor [Aliikangiella sp. IMCC44359]|uniref:response regulator transcription factor n=1 Tax=Aliikangiella sp. IMCC44359 TaxID=3459125 RepID=UPI00403AC5E4